MSPIRPAFDLYLRRALYCCYLYLDLWLNSCTLHTCYRLNRRDIQSRLWRRIDISEKERLESLFALLGLSQSRIALACMRRSRFLPWSYPFGESFNAWQSPLLVAQSRTRFGRALKEIML